MGSITRFLKSARSYAGQELTAGILLSSTSSKHVRDLVAGILVASLFAGTFFALIKPINASNLSFVTAVLFWSLHGIFGFGFIFLADLILLQTSLLRWARIILVLSVLPFVLAPFSMFIDDAFGATDFDPPTRSGMIAIFLDEVIEIAPLAWIVFGTSAFVAPSISLAFRRKGEDADDKDRPKLFEILEGLPPALGDDLIRIEAQDHYTRVVTSMGQHLISLNFSQCVNKVSEWDGVQIHRSHWVKLDRIVDLQRTGSTYLCSLSNGDEVPVSRRRYSILKHLLRASTRKMSIY